MKYRQIGPFRTSAIAYGSMPLSIEGRPDRETAINILHDVLDAGCTHIDTAWAYYESGGVEQYGERLVTDALASWDGDHSTISVATKVGHFRCFNDAGQPVWDVDGSPERLRRDAKLSAEALRTDQIDLLYLHRPDLKVEYEGMVRTLAGILDDGLARTAGISNANPDQIRLAHSILGDRLVAVQNQFSPGFLSSRPELELCGELGLAFVAWSPLGGYRRPLDEDAFAAFQRIADARGISRAQVILAWELSKGPHVIPIPGSHRSQTILDSLRSVDVTLNDEELAQLP